MNTFWIHFLWKTFIKLISFILFLIHTYRIQQSYSSDDVRLPASALLGQENRGFYYLMGELPQERLLIANLGMASCEWMFEEARNYVKQRKAFGRTIANLQVRDQTKHYPGCNTALYMLGFL